MICISDNDILLKLSACGLIEEAFVVLEAAKSDIYVLPSARYKISKDKKLLSKYGAEGISTALAFIDTVMEIDQKPVLEEQAILAQVEDIDVGEQILFGVTAHFDSFVVATGDKRSLRALHTHPSCQSICTRLSGRVLCLEQIVSYLIPSVGFEEARSRIVPVRECDTVLKAAFGSGLQSDEAAVMQYLANRILELRTETGDLLRQP